MKKLLIILLLLSSIPVLSQTSLKRNRIEADTLATTLHFIWRGDTIVFSDLSKIQFSADTVNWHGIQDSADKYFRAGGLAEDYYRHFKIWDGRTLDVDTNQIINVSDGTDSLHAVNLRQLISAMSSVNAYDSLVFSISDGYLRGYKDGLVLDSTTLDGRYLTIANAIDSFQVVRDTLAIHLDTLEAHNTRILTLNDSIIAHRTDINLRKSNSDSTALTGYVSNWALKDSLDNYWSRQAITEADTTRWGEGAGFIESDPIFTALKSIKTDLSTSNDSVSTSGAVRAFVKAQSFGLATDAALFKNVTPDSYVNFKAGSNTELTQSGDTIIISSLGTVLDTTNVESQHDTLTADTPHTNTFANPFENTDYQIVPRHGYDSDGRAVPINITARTVSGFTVVSAFDCNYEWVATRNGIAAVLGGGGITSVSSSNTDLLTVTNPTTTPILAIQVADITNGGVNLATGDQIYDFITNTALVWQTAPATKTSTGTVGMIAKDDNYLYICTATDTWKRVALATNW